MNKLARILSTALVGASLFMGAASALTGPVNCGDISDTGPGSSNNITCHVNENQTAICNNNGKVDASSDQKATTGGAFVVGNTTGEDATSGSATNQNDVNIKLGALCSPVAATTSTPTPTATSPAAASTPTVTVNKPVAGGRGGGEVSAPAAASLPETGSNTAAVTATVSAVVLAGAAAASQFGIRAYRRFALK